MSSCLQRKGPDSLFTDQESDFQNNIYKEKETKKQNNDVKKHNKSVKSVTHIKLYGKGI